MEIQLTSTTYRETCSRQPERKDWLRFPYNAFNQQTAVAMPNGNRLESRYDAEYLRAGTAQNGSITSFSYYNGELLAESSSDGDVISRYILGYGVAAGWNREKEGYHPYHLDEQNSTAYITGINGEIENHYEYDAFGVVQTHQEEIHNRILYTGQQYDQSSGQYYLRARYYNPVVGRFSQEDVYRLMTLVIIIMIINYTIYKVEAL